MNDRGGLYQDGEPKLGRRLVAAALQAAGLALLLAGLLMSAYAYISLRADLLETIQVQARVTAYNSAAPILFADAQAAAETLSSLRAAPSMTCAVLSNEVGTVLARWRSDNAPSEAEDEPCEPKEAALRSHWRSGLLLHVSEPVVHDGSVVGRIVVGASMAALQRRVVTYIVVGLLAASLALVLAWLQVLRIRREMDVTENRLAELVYLDPVSGLPNRRAANSRVDALQRGHARADHD
ncbi:MAG: hypothetical protein EOO24_03715, partial [Comamonadaceae bacterium]